MKAARRRRRPAPSGRIPQAERIYSMKTKILLIVLLNCLSTIPSIALTVPDRIYGSVVAVGQEVVHLNANNQIVRTRELLGTGVIVQDRHFVLLTARHVVFDDQKKELRPNLIYWGNTKNGNEFQRSFLDIPPEWKNIRWVIDEKADLAAIIVGIYPDQDAISTISVNDFIDIAGLNKGDDIYYLGFPRELGSEIGSDPMLRKGIVALKRFDDAIFYIDATVAGGNSGGPVFKQISDKEIKLIGIVTAFPGTFTPEGHFYHTGIGIVYPVDHIKRLLESKEFEGTR